MANFDWDITKSSLFTGLGTPWGPTQYGVGDEPKAPKERRLEEFSAFDRSPLVKELEQTLKSQQGSRQAQAGAQASKLGVGKSSGTVGMMQGIAADTEGQINKARYQAALDSFKEQLGQKQFAEQMDMNRYKLDLDKYKSEREISQAEKSKRQGLLGPFGVFAQ